MKRAMVLMPALRKTPADQREAGENRAPVGRPRSLAVRARTGWRLAVTFTVLHLISAHAVGQTKAGGLPEGWSELSVSEFVDRAQPVFPPKDLAAKKLAWAIRAHAAERLLGLPAQAAGDYEDLFTLYRWARSRLTAEQQQAVLSSLEQRAPLESVPSWTLPVR